MVNNKNLKLDLRIFEPTNQGKDKVHEKIKNTNAELTLREIMKKYFS